MWSTRDGEVGPTPAGPILRWHSHVVCKAGKKRGLKPPASGVCPPGSRLQQGASEMLHVWFTDELRSAFAITRAEAGAVRGGTSSRATTADGGSGHHAEVALALGLRELATCPGEPALGELDELVDSAADLDTRRCARCRRAARARSSVRSGRTRPQ